MRRRGPRRQPVQVCHAPLGPPVRDLAEREADEADDDDSQGEREREPDHRRSGEHPAESDQEPTDHHRRGVKAALGRAACSVKLRGHDCHHDADRHGERHPGQRSGSECLTCYDYEPAERDAQRIGQELRAHHCLDSRINDNSFQYFAGFSSPSGET